MTKIDQGWFGLERYFETLAGSETPSWHVHEDGECWAVRQEFRFGTEDLQRRVAVVSTTDWGATYSVASVDWEEIDHDPGPLTSHRGALKWLARALVHGVAKCDEVRQTWEEHYQKMVDVHEDYLQWSRLGQNQGRNAPCPCGSGRKYKKCCRRRRSQLEEQLSQPTDGPGDAVARQWWDGATTDEALMVIYHITSLFQEAGGLTYPQGEKAARGLGLPIDGVQEVGPLDDPWWIPPGWRDAADRLEEPARSVAEGALPYVAAHQQVQKAPWVVAAQLYFTAINMDYDEELSLEEVRFFWQDYRRWLAAVDERAEASWKPEPGFKEALDREMDHLLECCRSYLDDDVDQEVRQEALALVQEISQVCHEVMPEWANEAAIYGVAAHISAGEHEAATEYLEQVASRPVTKAHIPVYLGDLFLDHGMDWEHPQLELIGQQARRYAKSFDGHQADLLKRLAQALGELMEGGSVSI